MSRRPKVLKSPAKGGGKLAECKDLKRARGPRTGTSRSEFAFERRVEISRLKDRRAAKTSPALFAKLGNAFRMARRALQRASGRGR